VNRCNEPSTASLPAASSLRTSGAYEKHQSSQVFPSHKMIAGGRKAAGQSQGPVFLSCRSLKEATHMGVTGLNLLALVLTLLQESSNGRETSCVRKQLSPL